MVIMQMWPNIRLGKKIIFRDCKISPSPSFGQIGLYVNRLSLLTQGGLAWLLASHVSGLWFQPHSWLRKERGRCRLSWGVTTGKEATFINVGLEDSECNRFRTLPGLGERLLSQLSSLICALSPPSSGFTFKAERIPERVAFFFPPLSFLQWPDAVWKLCASPPSVLCYSACVRLQICCNWEQENKSLLLVEWRQGRSVTPLIRKENFLTRFLGQSLRSFPFKQGNRTGSNPIAVCFRHKEVLAMIF